MAATPILRFIACALIAIAGSGDALAQYMWLDAKGVKQYSDMPPPPDVPTNRVLQSGGSRLAPAMPAKDAQATAAEPTLAERNAAFEKRRLERAERERKESEQAKLDADKARSCEQARAYSRTLASGERISRMGPNGERSYLSDAQRAQETAATQRVLDQCKGS